MDAHRVLVALTRDPVEQADAVADVWDGLRGHRGPVLFKPNLIHNRHLSGGDYRAVVTQPDVLELAWVAADALDLGGQRAVADAPQGDADFEAILRATGLDDWQARRGVQVVDLRQERYEMSKEIVVRRVPLRSDPNGAVRVNLGEHSMFSGVDGRRFYGADYDIDYTNRHHSGERQEYSFSGTAINSDVVINIPKMKTHKKAGVTLSMKNLVGLNCDKNLLPHYSLGTPSDGGDAYMDSGPTARFESSLLRSVKPILRRSRVASRVAAATKPLARRALGDTLDVVRSGNWWGNDTIWRMILDLNRIMLYARPDGKLASTPQRIAVSLVDGIVAGEGKGPEAPDPVTTNVIVAGSDFVAVDIVATTLMGLDYRKVPHLRHALEHHALPLTSIDPEAIEVTSNVAEWDRNLWEIDPATLYRFKPHFGWAGKLERDPLDVVAA